MAAKTLMGSSQTTLLLDHLKAKGSITSLEAAGMFRIRSLSRRINDLEEKDHRIAREQRVDTTGQRYVRYIYLGKRLPQSSSTPPTPAHGQLGLRFAAR